MRRYRAGPRSPLEDPLSAKRSFSTRRRVQAFVLFAIAFFVAAGFAAHRYVSAAHPSSPASPPAQDAVVAPSPEGTAAKVPTPSPSKSPAHRVSNPPVAAKVIRTAKPKPHRTTAAAVPAKNLSVEDLVVSLTNQQRAQHGCSALRVDTRLRTAAREHSADMRDRHYFDHNTPDGKTPWDRIKADGYSNPGAENIAMGYATAQAVMNGWMNSPGHRANILNCSLKAIGVGVAYGSGGPWWTQDFGFQ